MPNLEEYTKLYTKKGSIGNARAGVIHFLTFVYGDQPGVKEGTTKKAQLEAYNQLSETYLQDTTRDRLTDAMKFSASMSGDIPHSAKNRLASLRGFFSFNGIEFTDRVSVQLVSDLTLVHLRLAWGCMISLYQFNSSQISLLS